MTTPAKTTAAAPAAHIHKSTVKKAYVKAVYGDMVHLFTGVRITQDPKKIEIDQFAQAQLDAGKWAIVED